MSKWETPQKMRAIGYTVLPLFCDHGQLNRGLFKLPVYRLPTWRGKIPDQDDLDRTNRVQNMTLWVRIYYHDEEN